MRLQITPGLPLISRGPATVQVGVDARHGTVVDGLTPEDLDLLAELATGVDDSRLSLPTDVPPSQPIGLGRILRARLLVDLLAETGVLQRTRSGRATLGRLGALRQRLAPDAAAWSLTHAGAGDGWELLAERRQAVVEVRGGGRTALALVGALAATGVGLVRTTGGGQVTAADLAPGGAAAGDVGSSLPEAADRVLDRVLLAPSRQDTGPAAATRRPGDAAPPPDLVVLVDRAAADPTQGDGLLAADVPHLSVVIRETSIVVGPLVVPGRSACLRCLDLHRAERDPQWPLVLAQLLQTPRRRLPHEETALAQVAAGLATLQVLGHLDGRGTPAAAGATLEVELPDGLTCRRPWPAHPSCGCSWPPAPPAPGRPAQGSNQGGTPGPGRAATRHDGTSRGQDGRRRPPTATMPQ